MGLLAVLTSPAALAMDMDAMPVGYFGFDRLESRLHGNDAQLAWEAEGWYGTDLHKLVLKSEGLRDAGGPTVDSETQLLYRRMASEFFDWQAGLRHDDQPGPRAAMGCSASAWRRSGSRWRRTCSSANGAIPPCAWRRSTSCC